MSNIWFLSCNQNGQPRQVEFNARHGRSCVKQSHWWLSFEWSCLERNIHVQLHFATRFRLKEKIVNNSSFIHFLGLYFFRIGFSLIPSPMPITLWIFATHCWTDLTPKRPSSDQLKLNSLMSCVPSPIPLHSPLSPSPLLLPNSHLHDDIGRPLKQKI